MEFEISLNNEKVSAANVAANWFVKPVSIKTEKDVKEVFCKSSYSPHQWENGIRKQANYIQSTFIVIDYDEGLTIKEARDRFSPYNHIIITSKSHQIVKPKHEELGKIDRFHILFPIDEAITDPEKIKKLKYAKIFEGSDPAVYETGRFFFPSPENAEVYINEEGKNIDIEDLEYHDSVKSNKALSISKSFDLSTLKTIRKHCKAVDETFNAIKNDEAHGTIGHHQRLLAANMIKNTSDNEGYVKKLFGNLSDYKEEITLKHYRSFDSKPMTCRKLQEFDWKLCPGTCELMQDIGKHSPIVFKYRSGSGLLTNDQLLKDANNEEKMDELLRRVRETSNPLKRKKLIKKIATESELEEAEIKQEVKNVKVVDDLKPYLINGKINEVKAAEHIINTYKLIRYLEDFYRFEDGVWTCLSKEEMESIIHKEIKRWSDNHTINETLNAVKREGFVSQKTVEGNTDSHVIACNNGLLDVEMLELRDFTEKDYRFKKMAANYDVNAKCPEFIKVLDELFDGDKDAPDKIKMLQEIMGYLLIPDYSLIKKMFYFWGPKANNGKSTILGIIQAVMGEGYIDGVPLNKLDGFMLKRLAGLHANIVGDQDAAVKVPDGVIKQLVGGRDRITADVKNKEAINFKNYARLIFAVNKLPFSQAKDAGYYTRVAVLVFNNEFVSNPAGKQKQADPHKIDKIIENELDGILNWMLEGLNRVLQSKQLTIPVSSENALKEYKVENNSVLQFVKDQCKLDENERTDRTDLYSAYTKWCDVSGIKLKVNATTFYKTVKSEFDLEEKRSNGSKLLKGIGHIATLFPTL
jgi:P4 family phage/plasmid primase-like protien